MRTKALLPLSATALLVLSIACASDRHQESAPAEAQAEHTEGTEEGTASAVAAAPAEPAVAWSYADATGPEHWGSLSPAYALCSEGKSQSPIDITDATGVALADLEMHYQPTPLNIVNNGHTVEVNYAPGSYMQLDGVRYDLAQFHFHSPSEHTLAGEHTSAEMHLVHKSAAGGLAVVAVMLTEGVQNSHYDAIWKHLPAQAGPAQTFDQTINVTDLLPTDPRTWRYMGSLTTPPGTEGVHWNIMTYPVSLSAAQIAAFRKVYDGNNRPVQPLNDRKVQRDTSR